MSRNPNLGFDELARAVDDLCRAADQANSHFDEMVRAGNAKEMRLSAEHLLGALNYFLKRVSNEQDVSATPLPLYQIAFGFRSLDQGYVVPMFRPSPAVSRARQSEGDLMVQGIAAFAMECGKRSGLSLEEAAEKVSRTVDVLGYRPRSGPMKPQKVVTWRESVTGNASAGPAREVFLKALSRAESAVGPSASETRWEIVFEQARTMLRRTIYALSPANNPNQEPV